MYIIRSDDGTQIACRDTGQGSPVLLVHGIGTDGARWEPLLPVLTPRFRIYMMDRRGRGASGDTEPYTLEREFEDVTAVVNSISWPVAVVGHGLGALCGLEAAIRSDNIRKLVLFEPVTGSSGDTPLFPEAIVAHLARLLKQGRRDEAVTGYLREIVSTSPEDLERIQRQGVWQRLVAAAPTIPRELHAQAAYRLDPARVRSVKIPTLVMTGGNSPDPVKEQARLFSAALAMGASVELPDQGGMAVDAAPGLFVRIIVEFLRDTW